MDEVEDGQLQGIEDVMLQDPEPDAPGDDDE
jgi:hypothetical protein